MKAFLDHFAAILGTFTVCLLAFSVSHEYGYFFVVGSNFQTFLSTTDYFANGVIWLPATLLSFYGLDWWRLRPATPSVDAPKKNWRNWKTWRWPIALTLFYGWWALIITWPPDFLVGIVLAGIIFFLWSKIYPFVSPAAGFEEPYYSFVLNLIRLGPPALAFMVIWGAVEGGADLARIEDPYIVVFNDDPAPKLRMLLRNFDKGILVKNPVLHRIEFYKWDQVMSLAKPVPDRGRSFGCWAFNLLCRPIIPPPLQ